MRSDIDISTPLSGAYLAGPQTGRVLVVDDEDASRELLREVLEANGHTVLEAPNGRKALEQLFSGQESLPDVVLLDILMPGMDGFEICRRIKGDSRSAHVPVIVVTGLTERNDRLRGILEGADDYLAKPFDAEEVVLRVRNGIAKKRLFQKIEEELRRVRDLEEVRDGLVHMIVHDLRQPLTALSMYFDSRLTADRSGDNGNTLSTMQEAVSGMNRMVAALLDVQKLEEGKMEVNLAGCDLVALVQSVGERFAPSTISNVNVEIAAHEPNVEANCDPELIRRVVSNLLDNAIKHTKKNGTIIIEVTSGSEGARVAVIDSGAGIPKEYHSKIFEKYGQVSLFAEGQRLSWGLGLTFCKMAVEAHHGTIGIESEPGSGSTFWFTLPPVSK